MISALCSGDIFDTKFIGADDFGESSLKNASSAESVGEKE